MKIDYQPAGPCRNRLSIEFDAEETQSEFDALLGVYARPGRVKGFRPGNAPREMVLRQYQAKIMEDMKENLQARGYQKAYMEHRFEPLTEADYEQSELAPGQPFSFSVTLEVEPEFELPEYKGIEIETRPVVVTDEMVTDQLDHYLEGMGRYEDVEEAREVREKDMVQIDYEATLDGQPLGEAVPEAKELQTGKDYWTIVEPQYAFIPEIAPELTGMKVGETKAITIVFGEDAAVKELAGKSVVFTTTAKKIRMMRKAELNEELFKNLGVAGEAELRESIRRVLQRNGEGQEKSRRRDELIKILLERVTFDLPESEVRRRTNRMVYQAVENLSRQGVPEEMLRGQLEELTADARKRAAELVKLNYVLQRIGKEEKIAVAEGEVTSILRNEAGRSGLPTIKALTNRLQTDESELRANIAKDVLADKALGKVMSYVKLTGEDAAEPVEKQEEQT